MTAMTKNITTAVSSRAEERKRKSLSLIDNNCLLGTLNFYPLDGFTTVTAIKTTHCPPARDLFLFSRTL